MEFLKNWRTLCNDDNLCEVWEGSVKLSKANCWYSAMFTTLKKETDYFLNFSYSANELVEGADYILSSVGIFNGSLEGADYKTTTDIDNIGYLHVLTPFGNMNSKNGLGSLSNRKKGKSRDTRNAKIGMKNDLRLHFYSGDCPDELSLVINTKSQNVCFSDFTLIAVPKLSSKYTEERIPVLAERQFSGTFKTGNSETSVYKECNQQDFGNYCKTLQTEGFSLYASNKFEENEFATYTKDNALAHVCFYPANNTLRIVTQSIDTLPSLCEKYNASSEYSPLLVQINHINKTGGGIGESYAIKLSDGSFIMVDGGHSEYKDQQVDILYRTLRKYNGSGKIRIAAWLFTHSHSDHFGCFIAFIEKYHREIEVEQLIYNFSTEEEISKSNSARYLFYGYNSLSLFNMTVSHYLPKVKISTAHTGFVYHIRNAVVSVLHTQEDLFPAKLSEFNDMNGTCTVFKIGFSDEDVKQEILINGDIFRRACENIALRYSEKTLSCYFMQVVHHGIGYASIDLYSKINPVVVLWPAADVRFNNVLYLEQNRYLVEEDSVQEIVLSDFGTREFYLPYTAPVGLKGLSKFTLPSNSDLLSNLIRYIGPKFDTTQDAPALSMEFSVSAEVTAAQSLCGHKVKEYGVFIDCENTQWEGTNGSRVLSATEKSFTHKLVAFDLEEGIDAAIRYEPYLNCEDDNYRRRVFTCRPLSAVTLPPRTPFRVMPYACLENDKGEKLMYRGPVVTETTLSALSAVSSLPNPKELPEINCLKEYAKEKLMQINKA